MESPEEFLAETEIKIFRAGRSRYLGQILGLSQQIAVMNLLRVSRMMGGEILRGVWLLGKCVIWVSGAPAQLRSNMFFCIYVSPDGLMFR